MERAATNTDLMAPCDVARALNITTSGVIWLARTGRLPELRDSANRRLFRRQDVERLRHERERRLAARVRG
jgi:hypothetical protein